ncbi:MAG: SMC-Scp complex subunit ScpB [Myxococcales bacterium]
MADSEVQKAGETPEPNADEGVATAHPEPANPEQEPAPEQEAQAEAESEPVAGEDEAADENQPGESDEPPAEAGEDQAPESVPAAQGEEAPSADPSAPETVEDEAEDSAPKKQQKEPAEGDGEAATSEDEEQEDTPFEKLVARARRFSEARVRVILESLLFVTDKPLSEEAIQQTTGISIQVIKDQMQKLQGTYRDGVRGIVLHEVAGGWQFRTCPTSSDFVRRFLKVKPQRLTRAALETLAIIAYRQPVTRPEIEDIRAVDCGAVVKALLDRQLIKIIGKKEEPGRPLLYGTTTQFLEFFNLRDLSSLPTLREFQELNEESQAIVEQQTGGKAEEKKGTEGLVADLRDSKLEERLKETTAEADSALADLETAIADTDTRTRATVRILNPVPQPPGGFPGAPPLPGQPIGAPAPVGLASEPEDEAGAEAEAPEEQDLPEGGPQSDEPDEDEDGAADDEVPPEMEDDDD